MHKVREETSRTIWYPGHGLIVEDVRRAENCYLYDAHGTRYIDLESGVWCTSVGHGHPRVLRVIREQSSQIMHSGFNYSSRIVEEASGEVLSLVGFPTGKCVFLCSGSEAVEYAVRTTQAVVKRPLILTMSDSYFGAYGSANRRRDDEWFSFDWTRCADCPHDSVCGVHCEHWAAIPLDQVGAFLFEPGSSSGLVRFPPRKLVQNLARLAKDNQGLVLANEVTTGVGRTGRWFGYEHYDLAPDVIALGKGIGNGYPVSVTAIAAGVIDRFGGQPLKYAQSHQNDPLGASIVKEVVAIIRDEGLIERAQDVAESLALGLARIAERSDRVKEVRSRGLMAAVELRDDPAATLTIQVHRELIARGYLVGCRPGFSVLRIDPSLTVETQDISGFLEAFEAIMV